MKRILFILLIMNATSTSVMASMSTSKVRQETRFLTDKMAYELSLNTSQYDDIYEINYDFIYSVRNIMDEVVRGQEWALDDYYEALDIRNDDLRWVLNDGQYRRLIGADYFYRPIHVTGGRWSFRVYINYPNRRLFYFGVPHHYRTYCGAHYRPHFQHASYYRGRHGNGGHYPSPHRVRDQRTYPSYRRSDFGSVNFRQNSSVRPHNAPTRPGVSGRPSNSTRPDAGHRPSSSGRPYSFNRPSTSNRGERPNREATPNRNERPNRNMAPNSGERSNREATPKRNENANRGEIKRSSESRSSSGSPRGTSNRGASRNSERESNSRR